MGTITELGDVALSEVEHAVGKRSFARGRTYARGNRVLSIAWESTEQTLTGTVVGQGGLYDVSAFVCIDAAGAPAFDGGECSCPVGSDCKHVAAIMIAAVEGRNGPRCRQPRIPSQAQAQAAPLPWEQPLRALIDTPADQSVCNPLAIELALQLDGGPSRSAPRLMARLMRPAARGGWVNGSLAWSGLESWQIQSGNYRSDHVALMRELFTAYRVSRGPSSYYYANAGAKTLDLASIDSSQLWSLLEEAARVEVAFVHGNPALEPVRLQRGELAIDVARNDDAGSRLRAVLRIDDVEADTLEPVLFLGASGRGVVCAERADIAAGHAPDGWRLRLVGLPRSPSAHLRRMLLADEQLIIPAGELQRFGEEIYPQLRQVAAVISSDGSFVAPEIAGPALVFNARYGAGHSVEVAWEWEYQVGDAVRRTPLASDGAGHGFRDRSAERTLLAGTIVPDADLLERHGLLGATGRPQSTPKVVVSGIDSMRLTTELLPQLMEVPDVRVEIDGQPPDFRDVGDALIIGVSTVDIVGDRDWFDLGVTISVEGREVPFAEVFVALARGESHMLLDDGAHFSLLEPRLQSLRALIEEARTLTDAPSAPLRISRYQAGLWAELAELGTVVAQADAWRRQVSMLLDGDVLVDHEPPEALAARLRPYQRDGFGWLASLWELELGGILADDMGLGKTIQALALILHARERDQSTGPFLVIAPTSVVPNWVSEAARFAPDLRVKGIADTLERSGRAIEEIADADVVVTTYTLFRLEADAYGTVAWAGVILDEAQFVKNHQAKTYRCVRELRTPFKLAITGTPMENNLMELWSLLSITAPGLFPDPKRFAERYARPIERGGDAERLQSLRRRIKPLVKRRTKELVAEELPAKHEQTLEVDLHPRHRKLYDTHLQRERQRILRLIDDFDRNRFTILRSITNLRQLSLHPGLVDDRHGSVPCAKLNLLMEQLGDVVGGGHRALVFSQFTRFLSIVRDQLDHEGIAYCHLDGRTRRRDVVIERFKRGTEPVFLISLKAGGFGLNLTEADYCFLLDPWWNPATETQAIDRAHRIGQSRPVMAYRMIARATIEEKVVALARRKAALFGGVMDHGDLFATSLTAEDIRGLLA